MIDPAPGDVGDMQQAVDAAEIDERTVVSDVLDHAFAIWPSLRLGDDSLVTLFGAAILRERHGATLRYCRGKRSIFRIWNGCGVPISGPTSRRGGHPLGCPAGRPRRRSRSTVNPRFDPSEDGAGDPLGLFERDFERCVGASSRRARSRLRTARRSRFPCVRGGDIDDVAPPISALPVPTCQIL